VARRGLLRVVQGAGIIESSIGPLLRGKVWYVVLLEGGHLRGIFMTLCHGIDVVAEQIVFRATLDGYSVAIAVEWVTVEHLGLDIGARHCGRRGVDSFGRGVKGGAVVYELGWHQVDGVSG